MPLLSVVVPAFRVQGYLRECLDSILDQGVDDLEVIVVDDGSPDSCAAIAAEYVQRDPRVRLVSLPVNEGLGPARNHGLEAASGEFVWFVDSDDRLSSGALKAVSRRLVETDPDVLIVDFVRFGDDGGTVRSDLARVLADAPLVFDARQQPQVLWILHVAWNRIVRREFLLRLGLRFEPGWYEDVSFSYPAVAAAARISALSRVCVEYRQRRVGAITSTVNDRHFEMFDHWDRAWERLDAVGGLIDELRPELFGRMVWHFLTVLGSDRRVPRGSRRRFFLRICDEFAARRPDAGYRVPAGIEGLKHRLVASRSWRTFLLLRAVVRLRRRGVAVARRALRPVVRVASGTARSAVGVVGRAWYRLCLLLPRDERLAVFASYWYRGYSGNPAAVYEAVTRLAPQVRGVWVTRRDRRGQFPPGTPTVVAGSLAYYRALARASYLVNDVNFPDFVVKRRGTKHLQTHHGTPLKVMGVEQARFPGGADIDYRRLLRRCDRWDFSLSSNPLSTEVWERAYPCAYEHLEFGYPRNDRLALADAADVARAKASVGAADGDLVVLYAPTHRSNHPGYRPPFDVDELAEALGPRGRLLARGHYFGDGAGARAVGAGLGRVLDVSDRPSVEELYLAADVLVTDYSSAMFDYAVLDRPIVIYAPDWQTYRSTRGVTFDLFATPPGPVATTFDALAELFRKDEVESESTQRARAAFRRRFCSWEDGRAAERVARRVFLGEVVPSCRGQGPVVAVPAEGRMASSVPAGRVGVPGGSSRESEATR
ncbi:bifunctional glycosyltransferase family 2 protein/CDP-glycerol:glycerophosphate glycerophosphotransferase [Pilimelia columellifera]|uniref:Bifunctional glycosyltransferase/CDP-glycerol:glycerophosphate glycerophosphotransferase n=1 Tax=Pilimelia columellifera subsp. columellifera TaxID=706583 RepID=A0ABP6A2M6_9ACTN